LNIFITNKNRPLFWKYLAFRLWWWTWIILHNPRLFMWGNYSFKVSLFKMFIFIVFVVHLTGGLGSWANKLSGIVQSILVTPNGIFCDSLFCIVTVCVLWHLVMLKFSMCKNVLCDSYMKVCVLRHLLVCDSFWILNVIVTGCVFITNIAPTLYYLLPLPLYYRYVYIIRLYFF
jgi:hypothetical protein